MKHRVLIVFGMFVMSLGLAAAANASTQLERPYITAGVTSGTAPLPVTLDTTRSATCRADQPDGYFDAPAYWSVDFGDGTPLMDGNFSVDSSGTWCLTLPDTISHTYTSGGIFTVTLNIQGSIGCGTETNCVSGPYDQRASITIRAVDRPPVAELKPSATSGGAPMTVSFDGTGSFDPEAPGCTASGCDHGLAGWTLKYGDGSINDIRSPWFGNGGPGNWPHTFQHPGTYITTLTVTETDGPESDSASTIITVSKAPSAVQPNPGTVKVISSTSMTVNVSAKLIRTDLGTPLTNKLIFFGTDGTLVCAAYTDSTGTAACSGTIPSSHLSNALAHGYTAIFNGDQDTNPSSATGKLTQTLTSRDITTHGPVAKALGLSAQMRTQSLHSLRGWASNGTQRVEVAVMRTTAGCARMGHNGRLAGITRIHGWCYPTGFLAATGTNRWTLALRRQLPTGAYRIYTRALDPTGRYGPIKTAAVTLR